MLEQELCLPSSSLGSLDVLEDVDFTPSTGSVEEKDHLPVDAGVSESKGSTGSLNWMKRRVNENRNDINRWEELFTELGKRYHDETGKGGAVSEEFKHFWRSSYTELLSRFPYLTDVWRNFLVSEYRLNGMKASINVLNLGIRNHSHSIDLWVDYLNALISQFDEMQDVNQKNEQRKYIEKQFEIALDINGLHFLSHPLWDRYLEFEESVIEEESTRKRKLFFITLQAVQIPLYQYAKYYRDFSENYSAFSLQDFIEADKQLIPLFESYLLGMGKQNFADLTEEEAKNILDQFAYLLYVDIQASVNNKWAFESTLTFQDFSLHNYDDIEKEMQNWEYYLDAEVEKYRLKSGNRFQEEQSFRTVTCLFERALVPNCFKSVIWLKYLAFLNTLHLETQRKFEAMKSIYDTSTDRFIPLDENMIRFNYTDFLMKFNKFDLAIQHNFGLIKLFSGVTKEGRYQKEDYLRSIYSTILLWRQVLGEEDLSVILEEIINNYFQESNKGTRLKICDEDGDTSGSTFLCFSEKYVEIFKKFINDDSVALITNMYLRELIATPGKDLHVEIRKVFNNLYKEPAFQTSNQFWKFFVEFEGLFSRNIKNLQRIISYINSSTQLPNSIVVSLNDLYYDIVNMDLLTLWSQGSNNGKLEYSLWNSDGEESSLLMNVSARKRLASHNYIVHDIEEAKASKQGKTLGATRYGNNEEEYLKLVKKHALHPGIVIDKRPEISNKIMNEGNWISLDSDDDRVPNFPSFRHVEKASLPINYPSN